MSAMHPPQTAPARWIRTRVVRVGGTTPRAPMKDPEPTPPPERDPTPPTPEKRDPEPGEPPRRDPPMDPVLPGEPHPRIEDPPRDPNKRLRVGAIDD